MAKYIDVETLKPLISNQLTSENEVSVIEGIIAASIDYDETAIQSRIDEAVSKAKEESKTEYASKLHDMFFNGVNAPDEVILDDVQIDTTDNETKKIEVEDIFVPIKY